MGPFDNAQILKCVRVPQVNSRVLRVLSTRNQSLIICHSQTDDLRIVLQVVPLFINFGEVNNNNAGGKVDNLLIILFALDIGNGPPHILTSKPVNPIHSDVHVPLIVWIIALGLAKHLLCQATHPLYFLIVRLGVEDIP